MDTLDIQIEDLNFKNLQSWRSSALAEPVIAPKYKSKVPAKFNFSNKFWSGSIRLKGDWTDHINSEKWSFRIKLDSGSFHGMKKFSIQHPKTRGFFFEAMFHQLLQEEEVLTTKYEFIHVKLNGLYKGIYALEEHFDEPLLVKAGKSIGPIMKFDETAFWEFQAYHKRYGEDIHFEYPMFQKAEILPFGGGRIKKDSMLFALFVQGRNKLNALRDFDFDTLSDLIDVDAFAKYYALCGLLGKDHGLNWHNQRFYFNPNSELLEPVAYDCWRKTTYVQHYNSSLIKKGVDTLYFADVFFNAQLFNDDGFKKSYLTYIKKYLKKELLINSIRAIVKNRDADLEQLSAEFKISKEVMSAYEKAISTLREVFNSRDPSSSFHYISYEDWKKAHPDKVWQYKNPLPTDSFTKLGIMAFTDQLKDSTKIISVYNIAKGRFELTHSGSFGTGFYIGQLLKPEDDHIEIEVPIDSEIINYHSKGVESASGSSLKHNTQFVRISPYPYYQSLKN